MATALVFIHVDETDDITVRTTPYDNIQISFGLGQHVYLPRPKLDELLVALDRMASFEVDMEDSDAEQQAAD